MEKHYVSFYSPGTFISECTSKEIDSWDVEKAKEMARDIKDRYGSNTYGFRFRTQNHSDDDMTVQVTKLSGMYFFSGTIRSISFIILQDKPEEKILRSNMITNGWDSVIEINNPHKLVLPFEKGDVLLDWTP